VFNNKQLPRAQALDYTLKGLAAEDHALSLNAEYYDAVVYKNILLRQQALYERDPAKVRRLIEEADQLLKLSTEIKTKQAGTEAGKAAGS
jgi:hypothetical protein